MERLMPISVASALSRGRTRLGVKLTDPEFPPETLLAALDSAVSDLHQNLSGISPDQLMVEAMLVSDGTDGHQYVLATQTPSIGAVARALVVRLDNAKGIELDSLSVTQLESYMGAAYALIGVDGAQSIRTSATVPEARPLFLRYIAAVPPMVIGGSVPAFIPEPFADVLGLMIAEQCFSQGGEQAFPGDQAAILMRRKDSLWDYWAMRSPHPLRRADTSEGIAPYLF